MAAATHDNELKKYIWADISSRMQILASARPSGGDGRLAGGCHDPDNWLHGVAGRGAHISTGVAGRKAQVCDPVRPCKRPGGLQRDGPGRRRPCWAHRKAGPDDRWILYRRCICRRRGARPRHFQESRGARPRHFHESRCWLTESPPFQRCCTDCLRVALIAEHRISL